MPRLARTSTLAVAVLALAVSALPAAATASHAAGKTACFGKKPTIFSSKNGAHLKGSGKADVIEATGKNVTVSGGGGNDRICIKGGTVNGGAGDDKIQLASGTANGGAGKDTIVKVGTGKGTLDGGVGPNTFTVPAAALLTTAVTYHSGDVINGQPSRIDAPGSGPPAFGMELEGSSGPLVTISTPAQDTGWSPWDDHNLAFFKPLAANGRSLAHWSVSWGDGSPVQSGNGGPPSGFDHNFLAPGLHNVTATVTDDLGQSTSHTITADVGIGPVATITTPTPPTTAAKTYATTATYGAGSKATFWVVTFGDGSSQSGSGAPPAALNHTFTTYGYFQTSLWVLDDHGGIRNAAVGSYYYPAAPGAYPGFDLDVYATSFAVPNSVRTPSVLSLPVVGTTVAAGTQLYVHSYSYGTSSTRIDWGDGDPTDTGSYHTYRTSTPVQRTITLHSAASDGTPLPDVTKVITVVPASTVHASLSAPADVVPEGPVTLSTAGTVIPPGSYRWEIYFQDGSQPLHGTGPVPPTVTHVFASGWQYAELEIYPLNGQSAYSEPDIYVTSPAARVGYFGGNENADWVPAIADPDSSGEDYVYFSGNLVPSLGAHAASGTLAFGDGTATPVPGFGDGYFGGEPETKHAYTGAGEHVAVFTGKDSKGRTASGVNHVSVATRPTFTVPASLSATAGSSLALPITGLSGGTNATTLAYQIAWDDDATVAKPDLFGFGSPPAGATHTYATPGTYTVTITVWNDHYGQTDKTVSVKVT